MILKGKFSLEGIPDKYRMGKGHVKFFYNKLYWLMRRYADVHSECIKRGYNVARYHGTFVVAGLARPYLWNRWTPSEEEIAISRARIEERLRKVKA
jgi:hypothetical protein